MRRFFLKFLRRGRLHSDLEAELAHHRELSLLHGNPVVLGNTTLIRENALDLWRFAFIENLLRDLVYAIRQMRRNPAFAATAVLSLALGIGLTTSIFSLLNAVALRPLPYSDPDRLVWTTQVLKANSTDEITITPDFLDWRRQNHTFIDLAGYNYWTRNLTGLAEPLQVDAAKASASLLTLLGVQPFLGRNFLKHEDYKGRDQVAILSYEMWQRQFGGDRRIIGRPIALDGEHFTVVGVLPRTFVFPGPNPVQIITPLAKDENAELQRNRNGPITLVQNVIGRLRPGVTREQAVADLTVIQSNLPQMAFHPTITIKMLPLREHLFGNAKTAGFLLICAAGFLLLIASANVSNLLLVRLMQRDRELAIRTVLGGSRSRIVSQLL
ncbi:MAG: ABC transporter permease, partial [Bryobacteraceae bacterium]